MIRWDNEPWDWESTMEVEEQPTAREVFERECHPENPQDQEWVAAQCGFTVRLVEPKSSVGPLL
eukprot:1815250-Karenia_brevis.AAC.1